MGIFDNCETTTDQGNIGQAKAIYELQLLGYVISLPITENQKYDIICEKKGNLYRVQIKTTKYIVKSGQYSVGLRTTGGNQSYHTAKIREKGDYDLLYVLTDENVSYLIPDDKFDNINNITLNKKYEQFKINI